MEIRVYEAKDAALLCQIHNQIEVDEALTADEFHDEILAYEHAWVGVVGDEAVGYTAVSTVPGLPHIRVLRGFVAPHRRRQGLGSQLLQHLIKELRRESHLPSSLSSLQLSHCTDNPHSAAAHFLYHHHFTLEHEEQHLVLATSPLSRPKLSTPLYLTTLPRAQAVGQFIRLYDESFQPHPWYQPYTAVEVAAMLYSPKDLLFLYHLDEPIGFAWIRLLGMGTGEIEPIGIVGKWQGRGYGRFLLQAASHNLTARGITRLHIGTWTSNITALNLYRSQGFLPDHTLTYLGYDVGASIA